LSLYTTNGLGLRDYSPDLNLCNVLE
jgi:hypothetical protein